MKTFNIDREKLARALELVKDIELHLELLQNLHKQACPNLRIYQEGDWWKIDYFRYQNEISASGPSPGEALDQLLHRAIARMNDILGEKPAPALPVPGVQANDGIPRVGGEILSNCRKCKKDGPHFIHAVEGNQPRRLECFSCHSVHKFFAPTGKV